MQLPIPVRMKLNRIQRYAQSLLDDDNADRLDLVDRESYHDVDASLAEIIDDAASCRRRCRNRHRWLNALGDNARQVANVVLDEAEEDAQSVRLGLDD